MFLETNNSIVFNAGGVNASSATPELIISSNGNVGIRTNNPTSALTVIGNTTTSTLNVTGITTIATDNWITSSDTILRIYFANNDSTLFQSPNGYNFRRTDGVSTLLINNSGNIGIGTTNPISFFHLHKPSNGEVKIQLTNGTTGLGNADGCTIIMNGASRDFYLQNHEPADFYLATAGNNMIFSTTGSERMRINTSGNVGIGTTNPNGLLTLFSSTQSLSRIVLSGQEFYQATNTSTNGIALLCGVNRDGNRQLWIGDSANLAQNGTTSLLRLMIGGIDCISTNGLVALPISVGNSAGINMNGSVNMGVNNITSSGNITTTGNVGIGTNNPSTALQVVGTLNATTIQENGTALTDKYLQLSGGTMTGALNFKIDVWNKSSDNKNRLFCSNNGTTYFGSGNGIYIFKSANDAVETFKVDNTGFLTTTGNIDCGGGIAITGSTAFYETGAVDAGNRDWTYLNLKFAGTDSDWCYIRQIGGTNAYKLAFDFHDDGEARFCIRKVLSTASLDVVTEVFTVDDGNVTCTGNIGVGTNAPVSKLDVRGRTFTQTMSIVDATSYTNQYQLLISPPTSTTPASIQTIQQNMGFGQNLILQGENLSGNVGIGITNPQNKLDVSGNLLVTGTISTGASSYLYGGGLRIGGWDNGNTLWQSTGNLGISANTGNNITFNIGNGSERVRINSSGNVGIGTTDPTDKLTVNGTATITSNLTSSNNYFNHLFTGGVYYYPPVPLTALSTTVTGQPYGNGTYIVSSSGDFNASTPAFYAFDIVRPTTYWQTASNSYLNGTYSASGTASTTYATSTNVRGEWIQIYSSTPFFISGFKITAVSLVYDQPFNIRIVASNTGTNDWVQISSANMTINTNGFVHLSANIFRFGTPNNNKYNYFRVIIVSGRNLNNTSSVIIHSIKFFSNTNFDIGSNLNLVVHNNISIFNSETNNPNLLLFRVDVGGNIVSGGDITNFGANVTATGSYTSTNGNYITSNGQLLGQYIFLNWSNAFSRGINAAGGYLNIFTTNTSVPGIYMYNSNIYGYLTAGIDTTSTDAYLTFYDSAARIISTIQKSTTLSTYMELNINTAVYQGWRTNSNFIVGNNVGIGTTDPICRLCVNPIVSDRDIYNLATSPCVITHPTPSSTSVLNDPQPVLHLCRQGTGSQCFGQKATFSLCRYEANSTNSRTRLDIILSENSFDDVSIMSLFSAGTVTIGNPNINYTGVPINNTTCKLYVSAGIASAGTCYPVRIAAGAATDTNNNATILGLGSENSGWSKVGIAHVRTTSYDVGDLVFLNNSDASGSSDANLTHERMRIRSNGNIGIGTTDPLQKLHVQGTTPAMIRVSTSVNDANQISGIEFGIPQIISANRAKIISSSIAGDKANLQFLTTNGAAAVTRILINEIGDVGIGTTNPRVQLDVQSKIYVGGDINVDTPQLGTYGGSGDRIILYSGNATTHPYSIGINSAVLWYSAPVGTSHNFFINGVSILSMNPTIVTVNQSLTVNSTSFLSGNVGIGTASSTDFRLIVNGKVSVSGSTAAPSIGISGGLGDRIILFPGTAVQFPYSIGVNTSTYWFSCPSNVNYIWFTSNVSNMFLDTTGTLTVNNDVIGFNSASDIKLKTNIRPLNIDCSDLINKIKPVEFNWKDIDSIQIEKRNKLDYGFIAQDIEKILPHLVKDITSHKIIKYEKFAPYLVKAIQEINNKLDKLIPDIEPNIYSICECSKNIIKLSEKYILKLYINCYIEIINYTGNTNKYQVIDINLIENEIKIDGDLEGNSCFVYGFYYNNSFETFNKNNYLNITQNLYSIINKQQEQIDNLIKLYKTKIDI
jgi:hypothetical protein